MAGRALRWLQLTSALVAIALAAGCADPVRGVTTGEPPARGRRAAAPARDDPVRAARNGNLKDLKALVEKDPAALKETVGPGETLLHVAAQANQPAVIEYLVSEGMEVDVRDKPGQTPLRHAAAAGSLEAAKTLVRLGADPTAREVFPSPDPRPGQSVLSAAAMKGDPATVEFLLDQGAPVSYGEADYQKRDPQETALHWAILGAHPDDPAETAQRLKVIDALAAKLDNPGDINTGMFAFGDKTPLHLAAERGDLTIVRHLLANYPKIDVNADDADGNTALHLAVPPGVENSPSGREAVRQRTEIIRLLLKHGAKPNASNVKGQNPGALILALGEVGKPLWQTLIEGIGEQNRERTKADE